jgi:hypothetical protein
MATAGGPSLERFVARPIEVPPLSDYLPQLRNRSEHRGFLSDPFYGVCLKAVVSSRGVKSAASLRALTGLASHQKLALLLFGHDRHLETLWKWRYDLVPLIAAAGYDLIVAPSYSAWEQRPRPQFLFNVARSFWIFDALQRAGAPTIPRVTWLIEHDVGRAADWINRNPAVQWIALDWMTYKARIPDEQLAGLAELDRLTDHRLRFLINGPTHFERCAEVFRSTDPTRVCITNATWAKPPIQRIRVAGPVTSEERGRGFRLKAFERRRVVLEAKEAVQAEGRLDDVA